MWRNRKKRTKESGRGGGATHAPELSGLYFAEVKEQVQRMEKGDASDST